MERAFAMWLASEMESRGWNQAELARRSNISRAHISRIATGHLQAGETACRNIARALGLPFAEVFRRARALPEIEPGSITRRLCDMAQALTESDQRILLCIAEAMAISQAARRDRKAGEVKRRKSPGSKRKPKV